MSTTNTSQPNRLRNYTYAVADRNASLGEEIRRRVAWIALAAREMDQGDFASGARELDEAMAWLMRISLEADELDAAVSRMREAQQPPPPTKSKLHEPEPLDAAAE